MKIGIKETLSTNIEDFQGEIWREISGYENRYLVSNYARIKSVIKRKFIILNKSISSGRFKVTLVSEKGHIASEGCGRLVAKAFIREPEQNEVIRYKDKNVLFDIATNLEWISKKESAKESINIHKCQRPGEKNGMAKLSTNDVINIRKLKQEGKSTKQIQSNYNISIGCINHIVNYRRWKNVK